MTDLHDRHDEPIVFDAIDDSIYSLTNSIIFFAGELLRTGRTWVVGKSRDPCDNSSAIGLVGEFLYLLRRGSL